MKPKKTKYATSGKRKPRLKCRRTDCICRQDLKAANPLGSSAFAELDWNRHFLAVANNRQRNRIAGPRAIQQKIQLHLTCKLFAVHGDENVATNAQFLKSRKHRPVPAADSSLCGSASRR